MEIDGAKLRRARERRAWTVRELGNYSGVAFATISRLENNMQSPRPSTVRRLAKALGIDPAELVRQ